MTVDFAYRIVQLAVNKAQNGYVTPQQFNDAISNGQNEYMSWLLGSFQQYMPGRPVARVELGQNQVLRQRLTPSIYNYVLTVDGQGQSPYPGDYQQTDAMWTIAGARRIRAIEQDKFWSVYGSVIDPYQQNPFYMIKDVGFQFFPTSIGQANLSYVRNPPAIVWGFIPDVNGIPVYDPGTSTDPIWSDLSMMDIISRTLTLLGVNLQAPAVAQYAEQVKQNGQ